MSELTGSNQRCRAQFKYAQTVVGQRFAGNGPNGLSYYYYCYYYCYYYYYYYYYSHVGIRFQYDAYTHALASGGNMMPIYSHVGIRWQHDAYTDRKSVV